MSSVKRFTLSRRRYITVNDGNKRSYGGNQEWFPKEKSGLESKLIHEYGCGVVAIADLFLYWAMTLSNGKETLAAKYLDEHGKITKENYMIFLEKIRREYAFIFGSAGTFALQLTMAINRYVRENHIEHKAELDMDLNDLTMLKRMEEMLQNNQPVILMIGHSFPIMLSRLRKKGIPFYKQTRVIMPIKKNEHKPYANYELVKRNVFGHFVMVTGIIIDDEAACASQQIMLRISSWGTEYYISYHHLRNYINEWSTPYLTALISIK